MRVKFDRTLILIYLLIFFGVQLPKSVYPDPARSLKWAVPISGKPGLSNLYKVNDSLYRGAQPDSLGFQELKKMGVKTVVNLRTYNSDREQCVKNDLEYIPISAQAWEAETKEVIDFLKVVTDPKKHPVFVHCKHGADRTGMMVAIYRMVVEGWSKEDAIAEMTNGGYGFHPFWKNLINYIKNLDIESIRNSL